jgi:hypothetical protein
MKNDSTTVRKAERNMFRSFLLEQGIEDLEKEIKRLDEESTKV